MHMRAADARVRVIEVDVERRKTIRPIEPHLAASAVHVPAIGGPGVGCCRHLSAYLSRMAWFQRSSVPVLAISETAVTHAVWRLVISIYPSPFTVALQPGHTSVDVSSSAMIAGPATRAPGASATRS
jgi:hypothetical protein